MSYRQIPLIAFITFILTVLQPVVNLPMLFQVSQVLAQTPATRKAEADRLFQQGIEQFQTSQFTAALQSWQQALIIYREIKDRRGEGNALGNLGIAYDARGNYIKAIDYHRQRLVITREIKDRQGEGQALGNLGIAYASLGKYPKAIEYYQQKLVIAREVKDHKGLVSGLGNLGLAYYFLGDYTKAIDYHQQSLLILRKMKDRLGEGIVLGNLGIAYYFLGDYTKAIDYYQQSLIIASDIKDRLGESNALGNLGLAYKALGNFTKAIDYYQQSLIIASDIKDRKNVGQSLGNLGNAYHSQGDYTKAIDYHQQYLDIARKIKDRKGESNALGNIGNVYHAQGHFVEAIDYYKQSLDIDHQIKDLNGEGLSLNNLGLALYKSGNLAKAEKNLFTGIEVWESIRKRLGNNDSYKVSIFEQQARTYRTLQQVLIAQNKTNEALEISERGRSRAFVELLNSRLSNTNTSQTSPPAVDKPTIALLQKIAKQQNATLVQYSIIGDDFKIDGKRQAKQSELYIWVIKPTGEITFRKSDLKPLWQKENTTLAELVTISRESIGVRGRGAIFVNPDPNAPKPKPRFQTLHELLITPIADLLPKKDTEKVVFIPQSELFLVPFPALQDEKGKYLIEKHTILTAPSIQILDLTHKQKLRQTTKSQPSLIVGNPTMPTVLIEPGQPAQQLKPLIWAEKEAKDIASLMNISALTGNKATKTAILEKMSQAGIIHFATHGLLDEYRGIGSAIALAPSGKDDGLLTADEILNLKLNADLVVLSACDTGRGRITGDGVVGLSRSLISAGTASIIVSLWKVDDNSTSFLMSEFYKNREQKLDKATALRKAMLTTKAKYSSPLNWAAFTLIGESE
ncbi:MAG: tetratricopeptide repeat protein [Dolichospermum sp. OL03]|nr:tetratricopeptide repeat protein [Dolichospermum sp. OL01]MCO5799823.1 tetratricopeptide repeat protein [Dolichospermum sp. OL03]MCS6280754.1 tetratricopeptide repeat protein [Dolichospermum sp.]